MADVYGRSPTVKSTKSYPKKSSSKKGSGDKKLEEYKNNHSSSGTSKPTITNRTDEERKANQQITSDVERANGIDRTREALQNINNEKAKAEFNNSGSPAVVGASIMPGSLPDVRSMYPEGDYRNHIDQGKSLVGVIRAETYKANQKVSSYIPSFNEVIEKRQQLEQSNKAFGDSMQLIRDTARSNPKVSSGVDNFAAVGKGVYDEVDRNPVGIGLTVASGAVGGAGFKVGSAAGKFGLLKVASMAGKGSKVGKGLSLTSKAIDPALAVGGISLTGNAVKDKTPEELGHAIPHIMGGFIGAGLGWKAAGSKINTYSMNRAFNSRYNNPSKITQVDGARNGRVALDSEIKPIQTTQTITGTTRNNQLNILSRTRRGGQYVDSNTKFGDTFEVVTKPKDHTIKSNIKVYGESAKPKKYNFEMEAPLTESVKIQTGRVQNNLKFDIPKPENPLHRVTANRRNLKNTNQDWYSKKSLWKDETAQLMTRNEINPTSQVQRPVFERGFSSEIIPEKTMMFRSSNLKQGSRYGFMGAFGVSTKMAGFNAVDNQLDLTKVSAMDKAIDSVMDSITDRVTDTKSVLKQSTKKSNPVYDTPISTRPNKTTPTRTPFMLRSKAPVLDITLNTKSKKRSGRKQTGKGAWEYKRTTNKYKSPLDVKVKGL